jgi:hypothetical protein
VPKPLVPFGRLGDVGLACVFIWCKEEGEDHCVGIAEAAPREACDGTWEGPVLCDSSRT